MAGATWGCLHTAPCYTAGKVLVCWPLGVGTAVWGSQVYVKPILHPSQGARPL